MNISSSQAKLLASVNLALVLLTRRFENWINAHVSVVAAVIVLF